MPIRNKLIVSIPKIKLKWWILLLMIFIVVTWFLPQRTLEIQINTNSDTEQLFYIEIRAGSNQRNWHSGPSLKLQDKRIISANKVHHIRVSGNLRPWSRGMYGDKLYLTIKHPEYRKLELVEKGYRGKLLTAAPQSWLGLLDKEPQLEFDYPELAYQKLDYKEQLVMGEILRASEITRHISWVADYYSEPKHDFLPVLHQLVDYVNTHSIGRYDIGKSLQDEIVAMKNNFITIEERLNTPVGWRLPIRKKSLRGDFNGDGKLDNVHTLFGTDISNKKEMGLFVYYGGESKSTKPVKINKEKIEAKEYRLYRIKQGTSILFNRNSTLAISVDFKYGGFTHSDLENKSTTHHWFDGLEWKSHHSVHSSR